MTLTWDGSAIHIILDNSSGFEQTVPRERYVAQSCQPSGNKGNIYSLQVKSAPATSAACSAISSARPRWSVRRLPQTRRRCKGRTSNDCLVAYRHAKRRESKRTSALHIAATNALPTGQSNYQIIIG